MNTTTKLQPAIGFKVNAAPAAACFDYDRQQWVFGEEARQLRLQQLRQERDILQSDRAAAYLAFNGCSSTVDEALTWIVDEINRLERLCLNPALN